MSQDTSPSVHTSHASGSRSTQTEILTFPVNHLLQVSWLNSVLWLVRTPRCGATSCSMAKSQTLSSVRNRVWPRETSSENARDLFQTLNNTLKWGQFIIQLQELHSSPDLRLLSYLWFGSTLPASKWCHHVMVFSLGGHCVLWASNVPFADWSVGTLYLLVILETTWRTWLVE